MILGGKSKITTANKPQINERAPHSERFFVKKEENKGSIKHSTEFRRIRSIVIYLKLSLNLRRQRRNFVQRSVEISRPAGLRFRFRVRFRVRVRVRFRVRLSIKFRVRFSFRNRVKFKLRFRVMFRLGLG